MRRVRRCAPLLIAAALLFGCAQPKASIVATANLDDRDPVTSDPAVVDLAFPAAIEGVAIDRKSVV